MVIIRFSLIGILILTFTGICEAKENNLSDSAKNAIIIKSVLVGGLIVSACGYWFITTNNAKNAEVNNEINTLKQGFFDANNLWHSRDYQEAYEGFINFSKRYQSSEIKKLRKKLKNQYDSAQNAISILPKQMDTVFFKKAQETNDLISYQKYLETYPMGSYKEIANALLHLKEAESNEKEKQLYQKVKAEKSLSACNEYTFYYPNGRNVDLVKREIERLKAIEVDSMAFYNALTQNTISDYEYYITTFSFGKYISIANDSIRIQTDRRKKRDIELYRSAIAQNSIESYNAYINEFPNGLHSSEANQWIKEYKERKTIQLEKTNRINEIISDICFRNTNIKRMQQLISQEKRVAARSGYEDKVLIHKTTQGIIYIEDQIKELKSKYYSLTKKPFVNQLCNTIETY